jgi:hypothetical protein
MGKTANALHPFLMNLRSSSSFDNPKRMVKKPLILISPVNLHNLRRVERFCRRKSLCRSSFSIGHRTAKIHVGKFGSLLCLTGQPLSNEPCGLEFTIDLLRSTTYGRIKGWEAVEEGVVGGRSAAKKGACAARFATKSNASKKPRTKWAVGLNRFLTPCAALPMTGDLLLVPQQPYRSANQSWGFKNSRSSASREPGAGWKSYNQRARGGRDMRIDSIRPPVFNPKTVPRS